MNTRLASVFSRRSLLALVATVSASAALLSAHPAAAAVALLSKLWVSVCPSTLAFARATQDRATAAVNNFCCSIELLLSFKRQ